MSKPSRKSNRKPKRDLPPAPKAMPWRPVVAKAAKALTALVAIVGLLLALPGIWPSLSISHSDQIDATQPFSAVFKITNSGFFALEHVMPTCYMYDIMYNNIEPKPIETPCLAMTRDTWRVPLLERGESRSITCSVSLEPPPHKANAAIAVDYRVFGYPIRRTALYSGLRVDKWTWLEQPGAEVPSRVSSCAKFDDKPPLERMHPLSETNKQELRKFLRGEEAEFFIPRSK